MSKTPAPDTIKYAVLEALTHQPPGPLHRPKHAILEYLQRYVAIPNNAKERHRVHQSLNALYQAGILTQHGIIYTPGANAKKGGSQPQPIEVEVSPYVQALPHGKWRGTIMGQGKPKKIPSSTSGPLVSSTKYEDMPTNDGIPLRQVGLDLLDSVIDMIRSMGDSPENHVLLSSMEMVRYISTQEADFHDRYDAWVGSGTGRKVPKHI